MSEPKSPSPKLRTKTNSQDRQPMNHFTSSIPHNMFYNHNAPHTYSSAFNHLPQYNPHHFPQFHHFQPQDHQFPQPYHYQYNTPLYAPVSHHHPPHAHPSQSPQFHPTHALHHNAHPSQSPQFHPTHALHHNAMHMPPSPYPHPHPDPGSQNQFHPQLSHQNLHLEPAPQLFHTISSTPDTPHSTQDVVRPRTSSLPNILQNNLVHPSLIQAAHHTPKYNKLFTEKSYLRQLINECRPMDNDLCRGILRATLTNGPASLTSSIGYLKIIGDILSQLRECCGSLGPPFPITTTGLSPQIRELASQGMRFWCARLARPILMGMLQDARALNQVPEPMSASILDTLLRQLGEAWLMSRKGRDQEEKDNDDAVTEAIQNKRARQEKKK